MERLGYPLVLVEYLRGMKAKKNNTMVPPFAESAAEWQGQWYKIQKVARSGYAGSDPQWYMPDLALESQVHISNHRTRP